MNLAHRGLRFARDLDACLTIVAGGAAVVLAWNLAPTGLAGFWAALSVGALGASVARPHSGAPTVAIAVLWLWWCLGRPAGTPDAATLALAACCLAIHVTCARRLGPVTRHPEARARQRAALALPLVALIGSGLIAVAATWGRDLAWTRSRWLDVLAVALVACCAAWLRWRHR